VGAREAVTVQAERGRETCLVFAPTNPALDLFQCCIRSLLTHVIGIDEAQVSFTALLGLFLAILSG